MIPHLVPELTANMKKELLEFSVMDGPEAWHSSADRNLYGLNIFPDHFGG